jgi:hypothetical protein
MRLPIPSRKQVWAVLALALVAGCGGADDLVPPAGSGAPPPSSGLGGPPPSSGDPAAPPPSSDPAAPDPPRDPDAPLIEGNRYSYCDPAAAIAAHPRFSAVPELVARVQGGPGGRDYPVIDVHTHLGNTRTEEAELQRAAGVCAVVDASEIPSPLSAPDAWGPASTARRYAAYPAPSVVQFYLGEYLDGFSEEKLPEILARFDEQRAAGAGGIKLFKQFGLEINDVTGARLRVDDARLFPLWRRAAEERWAISMHIADPNSWMERVHWSSPYSKQELVDQFIRVVQAHPDTVFVAIHLLNLVDSEAELEQLGEYLARYPNLYADVAARSQDLALRDQRYVREFMIAHQDKLIFATDRADQLPDQALQGYEEDFKYWETSDEAQTFYRNRRVSGLALPPDVLEKFYFKNALRAFCGSALTATRGDADSPSTMTSTAVEWTTLIEAGAALR